MVEGAGGTSSVTLPGQSAQSAADAPRVAVLGASGFAGALAAALLHRHPYFALGAITARAEAGMRLDELYPHHRVPVALQEPDLEAIAAAHDVAIVAYPHGASSEAVAALHAAGLLVLDLSADFRLRDADTYRHWYGDVHVAPDLFGTAVYGLPEVHRAALAGVREASRLIAGPGCFPTAAILTLAPLTRAGLVADVVIDAKTGVSGAGRKLARGTHYVAVSENAHAYGVAGHRHQPEIRQELAGQGMDAALQPVFVPHLLPVDQGELVSCYVRPTRDVTADEVAELFREAYGEEPFVELTEAEPGMRDVLATNIARIRTHVDPLSGRILAFGAIDNLWKGTSSQAIQSLNVAFGRPEDEGLQA
ncbi:N-acetyl-gamma-glutamyl-phosphate reductase [Patulibacter medicamentivorans]|uniref:N-acetyl-gamma-glutamyl-phosphate reductase n=1 Tax=Patulibacter medicamentivorans TaxID=1097667 RepID=H0E7M4_9ACTN|nr:N-acetyl-gamma-glutamyl-phosphate reductase [Patulibacter medicamentivorans]EHN10298.1 N-acetyl-gamma-glutamyl-phosphate reductase [Patulibacter medicamentivorans]